MRLITHSLLSAVFLLCLPAPVKQAAHVKPPLTDFEARCHAPGVVRCFGFDSKALVLRHIYPAWDGWYRGEMVTDIKASGAGSLRFTIPPSSPDNTSGQFWLEFADNFSVQFGQGQEFYVQWRQRFSRELLETHYKGGNGFKQIVIGEGSRPEHVAWSCTEIELVVEDTGQLGMPRVYHSCGGKDGHYEPLEVDTPQGRVIQNAVGCVRERVVSPPCVIYKPDQWMTFQVHIKVGTWYKSDKKYHHDSTVQLWVAEEAKPSVLVIDMSPESGTGYDLVNTMSWAKYGKVWLLPYNTHKDPKQVHPTAYTWYDELIISRKRIADPK